MIATIGVVGAGLMGHGIALAFARAGLTVRVHDPAPETLAGLERRVSASMAEMGCGQGEIEAALGRIAACADLGDAVRKADFVVEAAPEKLDLKQAVFAGIEAAAPAGCILASNTSVLPIAGIVAGLKAPERALGTHWWNPPHVIPLVEVVRTAWTSDDAVEATMAVLARAGKRPVRVDKDVPGFVGNRLQHALWREAVSLVENGICDAETVDTVVKESFGRRLAVLGPLENADLVGTDLTLDIHRIVLSDLERRPGPSPYLEALVGDGRLGMASGGGFRDWTPEAARRVRERLASHLRDLETILAGRE